MKFEKITVFGGASKTINEKFYAQGFKLGKIIGKKGMTLIFGIGDNGMMGQVFRGALSQQACIRGITTKELLELQCEDKTLFKEGEIEIVPDLFVRKFMMFHDGDAIVVLPGGWGTMDEFSEFSVTIQTKLLQKKPLIFVNLDGFYNPLKEMLRVMKKNGCVDDNKLDYVSFVDKVEDVLPEAKKVAKYLEDKQAERFKKGVEELKKKISI